jgi:ferric-dicitrate binding protein FerR (iron transport regulator)
MTTIDQAFQAYATETTPSVEACKRLCFAAREQPTEAETVQNLLSRLPVPTRGEERALVYRTRARQGPRFRRDRVIVLAALSAAAAIVIGVGIGLETNLPQWWTPPLQMELRSEAQWMQAEPARGVELAVQGEASVGGTKRHPRLRLDKGHMHVEVDPTLGLDLTVTTREAHVRVTGTAFEVTRDLLGTHVVVTRGTVQTTCLSSGHTFPLTADDSHTCQPTTASGMLGRARALQDDSAPWPEVLETVAAGLALVPGPGAVRSELEVIRIEALVALNRRAEAREAASAYLASGSDLRRAEVENLAAQIEAPP